MELRPSNLVIPTVSKYRRPFSGLSPVSLAYDEYIPPNGNATDRPLVILHGLFGSKRNWQSLSKAFMRDLQRPVYALDLRNHGSSPHSRPMTYLHMAADVLGFIQKLSLSNVSLLGHSMGGKVAMTLALHPETPADTLTQVVVSDIAPVRAEVSEDTVLHVKGMETIESSGITTRKEADEILEGYEKDPLVRAFLLTNLDANSRSAALRFKIPIDILKEGRPEIESFPWAPGERNFHGHTLFVKGTKSKYINRHNVPIIKQFFPSAIIKELDTGHWGQPNEFRKLVTDYILDASV
ncbi:alpha beta-hydrolase [Pisolithus croceorrhizus]|nr:alpha beta-hydrolase [Pisolithus croceorrhizus]